MRWSWCKNWPTTPAKKRAEPYTKIVEELPQMRPAPYKPGRVWNENSSRRKEGAWQDADLTRKRCAPRIEARDQVFPPQVNEEICDGDSGMRSDARGLCSLCAMSISLIASHPPGPLTIWDEGQGKVHL